MEDQRVYVGKLTAEDEALPPGLFHPAEANALCVLVARREAGDDIFGGDEQARTVADEIDQQRATYTAARLAGADREKEEDAIYELDIYERGRARGLLAPSPF
jgi:hypothetical protein